MNIAECHMIKNQAQMLILLLTKGLRTLATLSRYDNVGLLHIALISALRSHLFMIIDPAPRFCSRPGFGDMPLNPEVVALFP